MARSFNNEPLDDEAMIRRVLRTVTEYAERHPGDSFNVDECVEKTVKSIPQVWKQIYHPYRISGIPSSEQYAIEELTGRIQAKLRSRARAKALGVLKSRTIRQFSIVTAENLLTEGLNSRGFDRHYLEWQKYRVKVSLPLQSNKKMTFFVKFKDVPAKVPEILDSIASIRDIIVKNELNVMIR